jgi:SAM-dependent MidA family methyltransferase
MTETGPAANVLRNLLQYGDLSFRDFVEIALYHPEAGYYAGPLSPVGKEGDYITSPSLSPVFSYAIGNLIGNFVAQAGGEVCTFVDIGCGDGSLLREVSQTCGAPVRWWGVDRSLERVADSTDLHFAQSLLGVPRDGCHILFSNELFDAIPFARLVMRGRELHELWIDSNFEWVEHEAPEMYDDYFASHGITLEDGQFADVTIEWGALYRELASFSEHALIVTFDYGYRARQLFHSRVRRFGTAASYSHHRVTRDLLANPGGQDLTAHINFDDLIRAGEEAGASTLFFDRQAKFLLSLGITEHPLFAPLEDVKPESIESALALREARDEARRLVLPDGIGEEIRVLVQAKGVSLDGWRFQRNIIP